MATANPDPDVDPAPLPPRVLVTLLAQLADTPPPPPPPELVEWIEQVVADRGASALAG